MFDWIRRRLTETTSVAGSYEQFLREFVAECWRQNIVPKSYDPGARAFLFTRADGSEMSYQLYNVFGEWQSRDQAGRPALIRRIVLSVVESNASPDFSPEKLPEELMPGIRSHAQISNLMINNWIAGAPAVDGHATAFRPFAGDLVACVMRDQSNSMSQMTHENLASAKLSLDQAMLRAMTNFRSRLPPPVFQSLGDGLFGCANLEDHQSALLLLAPGVDYPLPAIDGAPVAVVPTRNLFYLTGSAHRAGLAKALDLAQKAGGMPHFCSSSLLRWNGEHWIEDPLADWDVFGARQRAITQHQLATDYNSQKQLLDQYHRKQGQDIFVATIMLFRPNNSSETVSVATLASGTSGTLLPHADRLAFILQILDPRTGLAQQAAADRMIVAWSDAMNMVGHLFEQLPYLYPPRFRALGFPDADAWAKLKAVALKT